MKRVLSVAAIAALAVGGLSASADAVAEHHAAPRSAASPLVQEDPAFGIAARSAALAAARAQAGATARQLGLGGAQSLSPFDAMRDSDGATHVRYERTFDGLRVVGGDMIVHRAADGTVSGVDYASQPNVSVPTTRPTVARPSAGAELVVFAASHKPTLAWEVERRGTADGEPVDVLRYLDAKTGVQLASWNQVESVDGTGHSLYSGDVSLKTVTNAGGKFQLIDSTRGGATTYNANHDSGTGRGTLYLDGDNVWGNGKTTSDQSAAVDAAYGAAQTWDFYKNTFGRLGIRNDGVAAYSRVHFGTDLDNAFWMDSCFCMSYGDGGALFKPLTELDVAGHEMSHGVTAATAGLDYTGEAGGLNEATSDIFGTMVEFYANNPNDPGDYYIGEKIVKDGTYLRRMDQPSDDGSSLDCWSPTAFSRDPHVSSGIGNHFFYLLSEGTAAKTIGGLPHQGTTCTGATLSGIGHDAAAAIWYRALTTYMVSTTDYTGARDATIRAARDLYGAASTQCSSVVSAWNALRVPVGTQTCAGGPTSNLLANPGFESGASAWTGTPGVITNDAGSLPRSGESVAWLNGYGAVHTDRVAQTVTIPAAASAKLTFWLNVQTNETAAAANDTLALQIGVNGKAVAVARFSNVDAANGYLQHTVDLTPYVGKTVVVRFVGVENASLTTSFRVDDTSLTVS